LSLELSAANVLSQRQWQSVPHMWSSDAETSVAEAGVCVCYCMVAEAQVCEQLAEIHYTAAH